MPCRSEARPRDDGGTSMPCNDDREPGRHGHPASTGLPARAPAHRERTPARRGCYRRIARGLAAGALTLLASALCLPAANADEEEGRGWIDVIVDLFKPSGSAPVGVPLRKPDAAPPPPSATPDAEPTDLRRVQSPPPVSPKAEMPERLEGAEPAHVYRALWELRAEIRLLREALNTAGSPSEAELIPERGPVHVYVKALEVWTKVARVQRRMGTPAAEVGRIPSRDIDAAELLVVVGHLLNEVRSIKALQGVERAIGPAPPEPALTHSMLYQGLAEASLLLDALGGGPLGPDDVYRHAWAVIDELGLVGETLGASLGADPPAVQGAKTSADVAQLLLRATYKAINLQTRLGMDASRVPAPGLDRASPSQNYDLVNLLLAELARIKAHLGIEAAPAPRPEEPPGRTPADALAVVQVIVANLDRLSAAVVL